MLVWRACEGLTLPKMTWNLRIMHLSLYTCVYIHIHVYVCVRAKIPVDGPFYRSSVLVRVSFNGLKSS